MEGKLKLPETMDFCAIPMEVKIKNKMVDRRSMVLTEKFEVLNQFGGADQRQSSPIYKPGLSVGLISRGFDNRIQMMIGYDTFPKGVTFGLGFALRKYD